ncbi:MAG: YncE family protein [Planctomycetota bacterium]|nr:YncE family protein [Planctomycetota bacterium]
MTISNRLVLLCILTIMSSVACNDSSSRSSNARSNSTFNESVVVVPSRETPGVLTFYSLTERRVLSTLPVSAEPTTDISVDPFTRRLIVTGSTGKSGSGNTISLVDVMNPEQASEIQTLNVKNPFGVILSPDGKRAFVTTRGDRMTSGGGGGGGGGGAGGGNGSGGSAEQGPGTLTVIDLETNTIESATPEVLQKPHFPAINPDGSKVYVPCNSTIEVYRASDSSLLASIPRSGSPTDGQYQCAVSPDGERLYGTGGSNVELIDVYRAHAPYDRITSINAGDAIQALQVAGDGKIYVTLENTLGVRVYNPQSLLPIQTLTPSPVDSSLPFRPAHLFLTSDGRRVILALQNQNKVYVFDRGTGVQTDSFDVQSPAGLTGF